MKIIWSTQLLTNINLSILVINIAEQREGPERSDGVVETVACSVVCSEAQGNYKSYSIRVNSTNFYVQIKFNVKLTFGIFMYIYSILSPDILTCWLRLEMRINIHANSLFLC